jgi:tetratricopeptide (TPR) repeat protein
MGNIRDVLAVATQYFLAGRAEESEQLCRQVLTEDPSCADAWRLLGVVTNQAGNYDVAVDCLRRAIQLRPEAAQSHRAMGVALEGQRKLAEAEASYRKSLELNPVYPEAYYSLANTLRDQGRDDESIACYQRALELKPDYASAHTNLGSVLARQGKLHDAVACWRRAWVVSPNSVEAHMNLGNALHQQGDFEGAIEYFRRVVALQPNHALAHSAIGLTLQAQEKLDEAEAAHRRALELAASEAEIHSNLGLTLREQGKAAQAADSYRRALELNPLLAETWSNLGVALHELGELSNAAACFRRSLEIKPENPKSRFNQSRLMLQTGDFYNGWKEYESRWEANHPAVPTFAKPVWKGESVYGKTVLLRAEQGLGDTLQFVRYAALIKKLGANVVVRCQSSLTWVLRSCTGVDQLIGEADDTPHCDFEAFLLSLPHICRTTLATIPAAIPYVFATQSLIDEWRQRLVGVQGFRIGINWHGRAGKRESLQRDIPIELFYSLAHIRGVRLISLQKGAGEDDLKSRGGGMPIIDVGEFDTDHGPFMDTAAVMKNLDLVITSDSAVAHLAGALGVPVWIALPFDSEFRWLLDREDSPWYPTMRLFRQKAAGDWDSVFSAIRDAFEERRAEPL